MLLQLESVVLCVNDIDAAAARYAALLGVPVKHENPRYAFVRTPHGVIIGFHPADTKNPAERGTCASITSHTSTAAPCTEALREKAEKSRRKNPSHQARATATTIGIARNRNDARRTKARFHVGVLVKRSTRQDARAAASASRGPRCANSSWPPALEARCG